MRSESSLSFLMCSRRLPHAFGSRAREKFQHGSATLDGHADDITFTVYGLDDARQARMVAEDLAQTADAHVDAAIEGQRVAAACELDELEARHHAIAMREQ